MSSSMRIGRRPAHAGTFYPADPEALTELVDGLLAEASLRLPPISTSTIVGALVPHAGLAFSGAVAAAGWAVIGAVKPTTLILVGTDHAGGAPGVAVWTGGPWTGPLGEIPIDEGVARRIAVLGPPFVADDIAHEGEHSLEVQMPFIARTCPEARVVPLLVGAPGSMAAAAGADLGRLIAGLRAEGQGVVVVATSDLAHYPPVEVCRNVDRLVLEPILRLDGEELGRAETSRRLSTEPGLACGLCGIEPVRCTLAAVAEMGATRGSLLAEATSADQPHGDPLRAVGYAAIAFVR